MKTLTTLYEVLGVQQDVDNETLRKAYRRLARQHHPDVSSDPRAHDHMARINEAFQTLIDDARRLEYDAALAGGGLETEQPVSRRREAPKPVVVKLRARLKAHMTPVYSVAFTPDTGELVSSAFDNEILWWNEEKPSRRVKLDYGVISTLRTFPEGRVIAAGSAESTLSYWHLNGGEVDLWKSGNEEWVSCVAISPDGKSIASGSVHRTLAVSNVMDGAARYRKNGHVDSVTAVAWSADGKLLASGSADATIKIWHGPTGAQLQTIHSVRSTVTALAFSQDARYLVAASVDLSIRVYDLSSGILIKMMFGHTKPIEALAFHPNGWLFASGSRDGSVGLWNAAKGIGNVRIEASSRPVSCVAFSPDGSMFAAGGQDKVIRLWDVTVKESA